MVGHEVNYPLFLCLTIQYKTIQYFVKADAVKRSCEPRIGEPASTHSRNPAQVKQIYLNDIDTVLLLKNLVMKIKYT